MAIRFLIKGATVLDGCGMPAYETDVRVIGRRIVEVGRDLEPAYKDRVFEATGTYLTPELIEAVCTAAPRRVDAADMLSRIISRPVQVVS